jgi:hypothetical protein
MVGLPGLDCTSERSARLASWGKFSRPPSTSSHGKPGQAGQALRDRVENRDPRARFKIQHQPIPISAKTIRPSGSEAYSSPSRFKHPLTTR